MGTSKDIALVSVRAIRQTRSRYVWSCLVFAVLILLLLLTNMPTRMGLSVSLLLRSNLSLSAMRQRGSQTDASGAGGIHPTNSIDIPISRVTDLKVKYTQLLNPVHSTPFTETEMAERMAFSRTEADFRWRRETLAAGCSKHKSRYLHASSVHTLILERFNSSVCLIPKVGSAYFHRLLQVALYPEVGLYTPYQLCLINVFVDQGYKYRTRPETLQSLENVLTVRNPYSRLLSAYLDKLFTINTEFWQTVGQKIASWRPGYGKGDNSNLGHDVTFAEFVRFVVRTQSGRGDPHFMPQSHQRCFSCRVNYTYILNTETYRDDTFFLMDRWGLLGKSVYFKDPDKEATVDQLIGKVGQIYIRRQTVELHLPVRQALLRVWRFAQIHGYIDVTSLLPDGLEEKSFEEAVAVVIDAYTRRSPEAKQQRREATLQAFMSVPAKDLLAFRLAFQEDFDLFGYDPFPKEYFKDRYTSEQMASKSLRYFDVIDNFYL